jgi:hypothetical protein
MVSFSSDEGHYTILFMHALYLPDVHSTLDNIIVKLVKKSSSRYLWTWEASQWMGEQSINDFEQPQDHRDHPKNREKAEVVHPDESTPADRPRTKLEACFTSRETTARQGNKEKSKITRGTSIVNAIPSKSDRGCD